MTEARTEYTSQEEDEFERPYIKGVIDRCENGYAIIRFDDGQELQVKLDKLSPDMSEGSVVRLVITNNEHEAHERLKLAKTILNEILQNSTDDIHKLPE